MSRAVKPQCPECGQECECYASPSTDEENIVYYSLKCTSCGCYKLQIEYGSTWGAYQEKWPTNCPWCFEEDIYHDKPPSEGKESSQVCPRCKGKLEKLIVEQSNSAGD